MPAEPARPVTYDEELLAAESPAVITTETDAARLARVQDELRAGFGALAGIAPAVSVFGSARTPPGDPRYELGRGVGRALARPGSRSSPAGGRGSWRPPIAGRGRPGRGRSG